MSDWNPKSLWDELVRALRGWPRDERGKRGKRDEKSADPTLMFHLLLTAPLLLGLLLMARRG